MTSMDNEPLNIGDYRAKRTRPFMITIGIDTDDPYDDEKIMINGKPLSEFRDPELAEDIEMGVLETREDFFKQTSPEDKKPMDLEVLAKFTQIIAIVGKYERLEARVTEMCRANFGEEETKRILTPLAILAKAILPHPHLHSIK